MIFGPPADGPGKAARIPARLPEGAGSNRQSRGDIVLVGDHEIEILSIA